MTHARYEVISGITKTWPKINSNTIHVLRLADSEARTVLQMFVLQRQGSHELNVDLTHVCAELLFQARDPGMHAIRRSSIGWNQRWEQGMVEQAGGGSTRALCLSSWGWRSVREARNWPVGLTDGAFGGVEKPGQASEMADVDDSEAFNCPQSHGSFTPALIDGACRSGTNAE